MGSQPQKNNIDKLKLTRKIRTIKIRMLRQRKIRRINKNYQLNLHKQSKMWVKIIKQDIMGKFDMMNQNR